MNYEELKEIVDGTLKTEFDSLEYSLYKGTDDRTLFDPATHEPLLEQNLDALSIVIRITDSRVRYYLCIAVSYEFLDDNPNNELPDKIRNFVKKVVSMFKPENYSAKLDIRACELHMLKNNT